MVRQRQNLRRQWKRLPENQHRLSEKSVTAGIGTDKKCVIGSAYNSNAKTLSGAGKKEKGGSKLFRSYNERILSKVDFDALWADDGARRALSRTPDEMFLRHPENETYESYASEISTTIWNSPAWDDRNPKNGTLSVDASINPLQGLL